MRLIVSTLVVLLAGTCIYSPAMGHRSVSQDGTGHTVNNKTAIRTRIYPNNLRVDHAAPERRAGYTREMQLSLTKFHQERMAWYSSDQKSMREYGEALKKIKASGLPLKPEGFLGAGRFATLVLARMKGIEVAAKVYVSERRVLSDSRDLAAARKKEPWVVDHLAAYPEHGIQVFQYVKGLSPQTILDNRYSVSPGGLGLISKWWGERLDRASLNSHDYNYLFEIPTGQIYLVDPF